MSKTVKVRIFVAVDSDGDWEAAGYPDCKTRDMIHCSDKLCGERNDYHWVTAEIPIPDATLEISGTVEHSRISEPDEQEA